jgi:DNA-binding NtrC family response regulator
MHFVASGEAALLGHLRERFPDTARLILSGDSEAAMAARAATVAYRSLTKPCAGADLVPTIERVCALHQA